MKRKLTSAGRFGGVLRKRLNLASKKDVGGKPQKVLREIGPVAKIEEISAPKDANWDEWVSASATRNYMLNDPLCDWLSRHGSNLSQYKKLGGKLSQALMTSKRSVCNFNQYKLDKGIEFEMQVLRLIIERHGSDVVEQIGGELNPRSQYKVLETVSAMMKGVPFIHGGLLHNPTTKTYGIPDLLVRSDWLKELVDVSPYIETETLKPAPKLRDVYDEDVSPEYHYVVVDIKFSTLHLRSDGVHLLNTGSIPAYKSQLYIYNEALALVQGYKPPKAYILGRKWCYKSGGKDHKGNSCFDRLGSIYFDGLDGTYIEKTKKALRWIRDVRAPEAKDWNIITLPLPREELYPNMSNYQDYPWRAVKEGIAEEIKEITSLWMMGVKNRQHAHTQKVMKWTDKKCDVDSLGVTGGFTRRILTSIIDINQPTKKPRKYKIEPRIIKDNRSGWQSCKDIEFYVDFETVNDGLTDLEGLPLACDMSLIVMIGVGYIHPVKGHWIYREFTVDNLTISDEKKNCAEFANYVRTEARFYKVKNPKCIHWAAAENTQWNDAVQRHYPESKKWYSNTWEWFDLLQVFRNEPIVIEGCLGFSLKAVAGAMKKHGLIESGWDDGSYCIDGQGAMVGTWSAYRQANVLGVSMRNTPLMREIARYNEVDVKVLYEIITYLRENHIKK